MPMAAIFWGAAIPGGAFKLLHLTAAVVRVGQADIPVACANLDLVAAEATRRIRRFPISIRGEFDRDPAPGIFGP